MEVLAEEGADQTMNAARGHDRYVAGFGAPAALLRVRSALAVASASASEEKARTVAAFLQQSAVEPVAGTYSSQSGEVVGILKDMRHTFEANLRKAVDAEKMSAEAYAVYESNVESAVQSMRDSKTGKQSLLAASDADLSRKRSQLQQCKAELGDVSGLQREL